MYATWVARMVSAIKWAQVKSLWLLVAWLPLGSALAFSWQDLWLSADQQGYRHFRKEQYPQALNAFNDQSWKGIAAYRAGRFEEAEHYFRSSTDLKAHYNLGNTLVQLGKYQEAIDEYNIVLETDPEHVDAQHNREIAKRLLEQSQQTSSDKNCKCASKDDSSSQEKNETSKADSSPGSKKDLKKDQATERESGSEKNNDKGDNKPLATSDAKETGSAPETASHALDQGAAEEDSKEDNKVQSQTDRSKMQKNGKEEKMNTKSNEDKSKEIESKKGIGMQDSKDEFKEKASKDLEHIAKGSETKAQEAVRSQVDKNKSKEGAKEMIADQLEKGYKKESQVKQEEISEELEKAPIKDLTDEKQNAAKQQLRALLRDQQVTIDQLLRHKFYYELNHS